jgi:hypothetical protein
VVSQDVASISVPILEMMIKSSQIASFLWIPGNQKEEEELGIRSLERRTSGADLKQDDKRHIDDKQMYYHYR